MEWWELFDATAEEIQEITQKIVQLYQRGRIDWLDDVQAPLPISFDFSSYAAVTIASPTRVNLSQPYFCEIELNYRLRLKKEVEQPKGFSKISREEREPEKKVSHSHRRSHSRSRSRSGSRRRSHSKSHKSHSHRHSHRNHSRSRSRSNSRE